MRVEDGEGVGEAGPLTTWGIALIGPLLAGTSAQARAGHGYARADFAVGYDHKAVTCPHGNTSAS